MDDLNKILEKTETDKNDLSRFIDSYASFNRIINSLQRKYLELKEDFSSQNELLVQANKKLVELTERNITATEYLNSILHSISAGVITVNQEGKITHFNPAASQLLGIPQSEPIQKKYREVIPSGKPSYANALRTAETGKECDSVEKTITMPDSSTLRFSVSTSLIKDKNGCSIGATEVFQDLTKIKKMENEIARLNTLAALGEMAATIAHEVRNPIAGIGGFAALLDRDLSENDPNKNLIGKIIKGVNNLNLTVDTLLNYTRFEEINKVETCCVTFLHNAVEQFKADQHDKLQSVVIQNNVIRSHADDMEVCLDPMLFRQVLFNLMKNGIEAIGYTGKISVQIEKLSRQKAVTLYADKLMLGLQETVIEIKVSDSGSGIPKNNIDKIFSPFFTTKSDGNGLGLAVAWKIVKTHGGDMFVENNTLDTGATFTILLAARINNKQGE